MRRLLLHVALTTAVSITVVVAMTNVAIPTESWVAVLGVSVGAVIGSIRS